jgi:hypothetical protein
MPLSDVVQRAADNLTRAAERLERGMAQVGTAGGRLGQAAAAGMPAWSARFNAAEAARAAQWPAIHAQRAAEQAPWRGGGLAAGLASGAAEALVGHVLGRMIPVPPAIPGIPIMAHGGPGAAQEALAAQYRAAQAGTALAVLARETVQAAAAAAIFTMTLRRAAGLVPVPGGGLGGGGIPRLPGPGGAVGFPGGPVVPYGGPRVRVVGATWNQAGAGGGAGIPWATAAGGGGLAGAASAAGAALGALVPVAGALTGAFYTILNLVGKAVPSASATFSGSLDLLSAKIGRDLVPVVDAASNALQLLARGYGATRLIQFDPTVQVAGWFNRMFGGDMLRSIQAPFQTGFQGGEQYRDSLQSAMLQTDELQARLMQEQLEATREWLGHARTIAADLAAFRALLPTFR